jgi:Uma2 family endonuclease
MLKFKVSRRHREAHQATRPGALIEEGQTNYNRGMPAATLISVSEYLSTAYRPDRDYVDGEIVERSLGEKDHSRIQTLLAAFFIQRELECGTCTLVEQRVQVKATRFRIPDVCLLPADGPDEQIVTHPPLVCIEVLSREDTMTRLVERLDDYLNMGVPNIWIIDPLTRRGYRYTSEGFLEAKDGVLRASRPEIELPLASLFE